MSKTPTIGRAVDWGFAATVGAKLTRAEPPITDYTREQAREQLADAARRAELPVREVTLLDGGAEVSEARIVDRPLWVRAATESMRLMTGGHASGPDGAAAMITGRLTGAQTGAVLAFISSGILGQYDPFAAPGGLERSDRGMGPVAVSYCWSIRISLPPNGSCRSARPISGSGCVCTR